MNMWILFMLVLYPNGWDISMVSKHNNRNECLVAQERYGDISTVCVEDTPWA